MKTTQSLWDSVARFLEQPTADHHGTRLGFQVSLLTCAAFTFLENRAFVLMQYFGYLRRNPNDPSDADYTGYEFWLTKLNQFNGNFINAEMVKAFISSDEYRLRLVRQGGRTFKIWFEAREAG